MGLPWTRSTVAAIENARRAISLGEFLLLPLIFETDEIEVLQIDDGDVVDLGGPKVNAPVFRALISRVPGDQRRAMLKNRQPPDPNEAPALKDKYGLTDKLAIDGLLNQTDTDYRVAKRLGVLPLEVALAARCLWGRGLADERDAQVGPAPSGIDQGVRRGHITRRLIQELGEEIERRTVE